MRGGSPHRRRRREVPGTAARGSADPDDDEPDLAGEVLDVCREIITDCNSVGLPSVIENLVYALPGEQLSGTARKHAIIDAATALTTSTSTSSSLNIPGHRPHADAWRTHCTAHGPCCRPAYLSKSSVRSSRSLSMKVEHPGSSPAGQSGGRLFPSEVRNGNDSWTPSLVLDSTTLLPWRTSAPAHGPRPPCDAFMLPDARPSSRVDDLGQRRKKRAPGAVRAAP